MIAALFIFAMANPSLAATNDNNEANAKLCLTDIYDLQKAYQQKHKKFAEDLSQLDLSSAKVCTKFQVFILEGNKTKFRARVQNADTAWSIDETKNLNKLR